MYAYLFGLDWLTGVLDFSGVWLLAESPEGVVVRLRTSNGVREVLGVVAREGVLTTVKELFTGGPAIQQGAILRSQQGMYCKMT